jgi:protein-S-isoprenylcysteine O-methyltransferase Ste14
MQGVCCAARHRQSWRFFRRRVRYEEWTLRRFFGQAYDDYAAVTPSGLPLIP